MRTQAGSESPLRPSVTSQMFSVTVVGSEATAWSNVRFGASSGGRFQVRSSWHLPRLAGRQAPRASRRWVVSANGRQSRRFERGGGRFGSVTGARTAAWQAQAAAPAMVVVGKFWETSPARLVVERRRSNPRYGQRPSHALIPAPPLPGYVPELNGGPASVKVLWICFGTRPVRLPRPVFSQAFSICCPFAPMELVWQAVASARGG